ncbi:MAG: NAD-binding protein [Actinobacteria bacterium]|nr:NAD-binding protein [Actinomycetota bacterium]
MKAIVVGAGGTTRELLRRLGELWEICVIDVDRTRLDEVAGVRAVEVVEGDGSSRVTLERAGLAEADAVVAATNDDDVNLEVCRLARTTGLIRLVAVAARPERAPDYREADVPVISPHSLTARRLELSLEPRRVASTAFARGRAEAIEFRIAEDSPVRGIALRDLHAESWLVAAILRENRLIVPHGNTVLRTDDQVTVVGAAADFPLIVRTFTAGAARFPLDHGKRVAVVLDARADLEGPVAEAINLTRNTQASSLLVVHRRTDTITDETHARDVAAMLDEAEERAAGVEINRRPVEGPPLRALASLTAEESVGVVVLAAPASGWLGRWRAVRALRSSAELGLPVLWSRGTHPYQQVVTPARDTRAAAAAARAAIDVAAYGKGEVTGAAVVAPMFLTGADGRDDALRSLTRLREEAAVQGVPVHRKLRHGNPVRVLLEESEGANLLVLARSPRPATLLRPGTVGHLLARVPVSVLVVPSGS